MNQSVGRLKRLDEFSLTDLEAVALIVRGESVIDWHRLNLHSLEEARELIAMQELSPDDPVDRDRLEQLKRDAISYLRRHFEFPVPKPVEQASPEELLLVASSKGHRQVCACSILKAMHIIHHLDGRELLFTLPLSDQEVFHLVEEKVYRVIGGMLANGFPISEFVGGRKNKDALYTKLLSKQGTIAAAIYDKLRFRIVTRTQADILPVLLYLSQRLFPFNYVIPNESVNTIFHFKSYCERNPHLAPLVPQMQLGLGDDLIPGDNRFSAETYRTIHFVVDLPVRLPKDILEVAPTQNRSLGNIVYVLCEFQLVDQDTEAANEQGEASHARYKERQKASVMRRLKVGARDLHTPSSTQIRVGVPVPPIHVPSGVHRQPAPIIDHKSAEFVAALNSLSGLGASGGPLDPRNPRDPYGLLHGSDALARANFDAPPPHDDGPEAPAPKASPPLAPSVRTPPSLSSAGPTPPVDRPRTPPRK